MNPYNTRRRGGGTGVSEQALQTKLTTHKRVHDGVLHEPSVLVEHNGSKRRRRSPKYHHSDITPPPSPPDYSDAKRFSNATSERQGDRSLIDEIIIQLKDFKEILGAHLVASRIDARFFKKYGSGNTPSTVVKNEIASYLRKTPPQFTEIERIDPDFDVNVYGMLHVAGSRRTGYRYRQPVRSPVSEDETFFEKESGNGRPVACYPARTLDDKTRNDRRTPPTPSFTPTSALRSIEEENTGNSAIGSWTTTDQEFYSLLSSDAELESNWRRGQGPFSYDTGYTGTRRSSDDLEAEIFGFRPTQEDDGDVRKDEAQRSDQKDAGTTAVDGDNFFENAMGDSCDLSEPAGITQQDNGVLSEEATDGLSLWDHASMTDADDQMLMFANGEMKTETATVAVTSISGAGKEMQTPLRTNLKALISSPEGLGLEELDQMLEDV